MKEILNSIKSTLKLLVTIALIAYPLCYVIHWISPEYKVLESYHALIRYVWDFLMQYGDWILIFLLSLKFSTGYKTYYQVAEQVRQKQFFAEYLRWENTPYVAPIMLYYLLKPPVAISSQTRDIVENQLYHTIVDTFRSRVYIHADYDVLEPVERKALVNAIGFRTILFPLIGYTIIGGFFCYLAQHKPITLWLTGYDRYAIPFLAGIFSWATQYTMAILRYGTMNHIDQDIQQQFGDRIHHITWRDVFPDRPLGETILHAWLGEREYRQRNWNYLNRTPITAHMAYDCPFLPPYPLPADNLPTWVDQAEDFHAEKLAKLKQNQTLRDRKIVKQSGGKVISLSKRNV